LTRVPSDPTVRINREDDKTLNLNLKVKPDSALAVNSAGGFIAVGLIATRSGFPQFRAGTWPEPNGIGQGR
jgi:hypothetical protein